MDILKGATEFYEYIHTCTWLSEERQTSLHHIDALTKINVKFDKCELPTFYWLPQLHKNPFKSRFISNFSHYSTTILSKHITSALTAVKDHVIKYSETAFSNSNVNYFWSIKFLPRSSESCDCVTFRVLRFSTAYTSLPQYIIQAIVLSLVNLCFNRESKPYLCTSDKAGFFSNKKYDSFKCWTCAEMREVFTFYFPHRNVMCNLKAWYINSEDSHWQNIKKKRKIYLYFKRLNKCLNDGLYISTQIF